MKSHDRTLDYHLKITRTNSKNVESAELLYALLVECLE